MPLRAKHSSYRAEPAGLRRWVNSFLLSEDEGRWEEGFEETLQAPARGRPPCRAEGQRRCNLEHLSIRMAALREGLGRDQRGWRLDPGKRSSSLPTAAAPSSRPPSQQFPFPSPCLCLSSQPSNRAGLSGRERGRMDGPRIGDDAPVAQDRASHLLGDSLASPVLLAPETPDSTLQSSPGLRPPKLSSIPSPKPPKHQAPPGPLLPPGSTFCELKDWVQWYRTRLSLGQWAGLAASGAAGASTGLAASLSSAEMGHQLQLVGVRLLGVAMTARNQRQERRRLRRRLSRRASHGLAEPAPLPRSRPPLSVNVITHWASGGGARGSRELLPSSSPWPAPGQSQKRHQSSLAGSVEGCKEPWASGPCAPNSSYLAGHLPKIPSL